MSEEAKRNKKIIRRIFLFFLIPIMVGGIFVVHAFCTDVEMRRSVLIKFNCKPWIELYETDREAFSKIFGEDVAFFPTFDDEEKQEDVTTLMDVYRQITEDSNDTE